MKTFTKSITTALTATAFLFAGPALGEQAADTTSVANTTADPAPDGPAMWKVADEDTTIFLFGTVHALPKEIEWYDNEIATALGSADTVVTEIKMDATVAQEMQRLVAAKGVLPAGQTLRSLLDDEQRTSYETAMGKIGIPAAAFDNYEPWYAGMMLAMIPLMQQGYSPEAGVENVLLSNAGDAERDALETLEFQIGVFDQLPQESQIEFLIQTASGIDELKSSLDAMVAEWLEGDAETLASMMNEGLGDATLAEQLLYARNRNWADWIDTRMDLPGTVFMAVGAGHLAGEKSVQDALRELGFEVARVR